MVLSYLYRERRKPSLGPKLIYNCAYYYTFFFQIIKNRQVATVSVFILSAIVHEYVLLFAFRFFYPILLIMFGAFGCKYIGVVFISFKCKLVIFYHCDIDDDDSGSGGDGAACIVGERKNVTLEEGKPVSLPSYLHRVPCSFMHRYQFQALAVPASNGPCSCWLW